MPVLTVTLDTNVPYRLWDDHPRRAVTQRLLDLAADGAVDLAVTRHIEQDVEDEPLASRIRDLPTLGIDVIGGVFVLGRSALNGEDGLGDSRFVDAQQRLEAARGGRDPQLPSDVDFMHLHAHFLHQRNEFLTWDRPILRLAPFLRNEFGLVVRSPDDFFAQRSATSG